MTLDETFRATVPVVTTFLADMRLVIEMGTMDRVEAQQWLVRLRMLQRELDVMQTAAVASPEQYARYAAPGQRANEPSEK